MKSTLRNFLTNLGIFSFSVFLFSGEGIDTDERRKGLEKDLESIEYADGVSEKEAEVIARNLEERFVGCGSFYEIEDGGGYWIAKYFLGLGARLDESTRISKLDGEVVAGISLGGEVLKLSPDQIWE